MESERMPEGKPRRRLRFQIDVHENNIDLLIGGMMTYKMLDTMGNVVQADTLPIAIRRGRKQ
jgi:hypothetical protein